MYGGYISRELGLVIDVLGVDDIKDGIIVPGDGASYYNTTFSIITFKPEMQEIVMGSIRDIADFGAFINIGPIEGMIHISQTMNDFVSFTKEKVLIGKDTKNILKVGDVCRARIIAISYKDVLNPKLGMSMRKEGLGKDDWKPVEEKPEKEEKPKKK
jgi:DNA-directed RNA polymerase subunit E'